MQYYTVTQILLFLYKTLIKFLTIVVCYWKDKSLDLESQLSKKMTTATGKFREKKLVMGYLEQTVLPIISNTAHSKDPHTITAFPHRWRHKVFRVKTQWSKKILDDRTGGKSLILDWFNPSSSFWSSNIKFLTWQTFVSKKSYNF